MNDLTDLKDYKNHKKLKIVYEDLLQIQSLLTTQIAALDKFRKYIPVMESISVLTNSKTLIEININKYKRALNLD